jgi:hypothetical protein
MENELLIRGRCHSVFVVPLGRERSIHAAYVTTVTEFTIFAELATVPRRAAEGAHELTR